MKKVNLIFISLLFLFSCCKRDQNKYPREITPILIGKGNISGNENITKENLVINSQNEFNVILNKMQDYTVNSLTETSIDFDNYTVLAVFDTIKPTYGFYITIETIVENTDSVIVSIVKDGTLTATLEVAQPFHIVKIPKTSKPIVFH